MIIADPKWVEYSYVLNTLLQTPIAILVCALNTFFAVSLYTALSNI